MRILAIDPGTSCGFALGDESAVLASGFWNLAPARGDSPGIRYLKLRARLNELGQAYPGIALLAHEQQHHRGGAATAIGAGIVATLQAWAAEQRVEITAVHSATLKKFATGSGRADKDDMKRLGAGKFQPTTMSDDEMDALWILEWARVTLDNRRATA
jgi:Holliday junction resolvasome RuvABC endonuclease subunit